ncbi:hypothetical protein [Maricaulis maris]|uniref:hypothetical protein n=1 Tax=Maricaulis maris TaxID=74318 RepID=UPI003B8B7D09
MTQTQSPLQTAIADVLKPLQKDERSRAAIGRELGLSEATVRKMSDTSWCPLTIRNLLAIERAYQPGEQIPIAEAAE